MRNITAYALVCPHCENWLENLPLHWDGSRHCSYCDRPLKTHTFENDFDLYFPPFPDLAKIPLYCPVCHVLLGHAQHGTHVWIRCAKCRHEFHYLIRSDRIHMRNRTPE